MSGARRGGGLLTQLRGVQVAGPHFRYELYGEVFNFSGPDRTDCAVNDHDSQLASQRTPAAIARQ